MEELFITTIVVIIEYLTFHGRLRICTIYTTVSFLAIALSFTWGIIYLFILIICITALIKFIIFSLDFPWQFINVKRKI
jgi:hypothetical protein